MALAAIEYAKKARDAVSAAASSMLSAAVSPAQGSPEAATPQPRRVLREQFSEEKAPEQILIPARRERERSSSRIPERRKLRKKPRRNLNGISVVEAPRPAEVAGKGAVDEPRAPAPKKRGGSDDEEEPKRRHTYRRIGGDNKEADDKAVLDLLPPMSFSEDYFASPVFSRGLRPGVARVVAEAAQQEQEPTPRTTEHGGEGWLRILQLGFSLLVQGVGSKRRLLEAFADETLLPWGAAVVRIDGFDTHFALTECLRDVLDQLHPNAGRAGAGQAREGGRSHSVEGLAAALRTARAAEASPRPLCLVVHNLDQISSSSWSTTQQAALASLAAAPGVHLVASVDSVWAPLAWGSRATRDFNWCREEAHTFEGYEVEASARYRDGLPVWCDPTAVRKTATKASLGLVLRSLTGSHRELVQVIARQQIDNGGRTGISVGKLLGFATDRMIASSATKLRSLLNELKDHEVVGQRAAQDGGTLFHLACSGKVLERLAEGLAPEESDAEDSENDA